MPATAATTLTDADWAGLCCLTETSRPEEQLYVLWVIRNRVEAPGARFGTGYEGVALAPSQFSAFNLWTVHKLPGHDGHDPAAIFNGVASRYGDTPSVLLAVVHLAEYVLTLDGINTPFVRVDELKDAKDAKQSLSNAREVWHYYSPVSMRPPGSKPKWAGNDEHGRPYAKRLFTPQGIDPIRFRFASGVA